MTKPQSILLAVILTMASTVVPSIAQNPVLGYFSDGYYRTIDPETGALTEIAYAPGGTRSWYLAVDPSTSTAYRVQNGVGLEMLVTNLITKTTRSVTITGVEKNLSAVAAYNGRLIGTYSGNGDHPGEDGAVFLIDPVSGVATELTHIWTPTPHASLSVDPATNRAVRISSIASDQLEVIDLATGEVTRVTLDRTPTKVDFFSGRAIGYVQSDGQGRSFREMNLRTGVTTFMADTPTDMIVSLFTVDALDAPPEAGTAYNIASTGSRRMTVTNLYDNTRHSVGWETEADIWWINAHGLGSATRDYLQPIKAIERTPAATKIIVPLVTDRQVGVEYSPDLSSSAWLDLGNVIEDGLSGSLTDPDPVRRGRPTGYYRAFLR